MTFYVTISLIFIFGFWFLYSKLENDVSPLNQRTEVITFSNGAKVYILSRIWGVSGNHQEIVFSETPITISSKDKDYIFYSSPVFYKIDKNTLTLIASQSGKSIPESTFKDVVVIFKGLSNFNEIADYNLNYEDYGLTRISVR